MGAAHAPDFHAPCSFVHLALITCGSRQLVIESQAVKRAAAATSLF